jgi:hypothetical protein
MLAVPATGLFDVGVNPRVGVTVELGEALWFAGCLDFASSNNDEVTALGRLGAVLHLPGGCLAVLRLGGGGLGKPEGFFLVDHGNGPLPCVVVCRSRFLTVFQESVQFLLHNERELVTFLVDMLLVCLWLRPQSPWDPAAAILGLELLECPDMHLCKLSLVRFNWRELD